MRQLRIIVVAVISMLALAAVAATTASAALPEFLGGTVTGLTFKLTSGKGELGGGFKIKCEKDKGTGVVTGAKTVTTTVDFEECSVLGQAANSLGDPAKTILIAATGTLCFIKSTSPLEVGVKLTPIGTVHIEVPSVSTLALVTGSVVGKGTPINVSQATGTVELKKGPFQCEGSTSELLSEENENKKPAKAEEITTESLTYVNNIELMG